MWQFDAECCYSDMLINTIVKIIVIKAGIYCH